MEVLLLHAVDFCESLQSFKQNPVGVNPFKGKQQALASVGTQWASKVCICSAGGVLLVLLWLELTTDVLLLSSPQKPHFGKGKR